MTTKSFAAPLFPVLAALCLIATPTIGANAETVFTFDCGAGVSATSSSGGAELCTTTTNKNTGVVTYHDPAASTVVYDWSVNSFDLTSTAGGWQYATGNGNAAPGLKTGSAVSGATTNTVELTDGGESFVFNGIDLMSGTASSSSLTSGTELSYSILGSLNGTQEFDLTGDLSGTAKDWITTPGSGMDINDLVIVLSSTYHGKNQTVPTITEYADNLSITEAGAPEPTSLLLLGSGLLALSGMVRRKIRS